MRCTRSMIWCVAVLLCAPAALDAQPATAPATAPSHVSAVTVYQGSALVTREVAVPQGVGMMELVVSPLPPQTIDSSLFSEGGDGIRILTTRYRTRAVREDARAEVRAKEQQIRDLKSEAERIQREIQVIQQNLAMLDKLENFTAATMQQLTEKGLLSAETTIALAKHVMESRQERALAQVQLQQQLQRNGEAQVFAQRELAELTAGATRTERDAVIVVEKTAADAATVRLNYLVSAATWRPQYKLRAGAQNDPVEVEYLASIIQQSGEDWSNVAIALSTAEPMLSAAPPSLSALDVTVGAAGPEQPPAGAIREQALAMRKEAQRRANVFDYSNQRILTNTAAAIDQTADLFGTAEPQPMVAGGPSVTYHLRARFTVPSRADEQNIEVARLQMSPQFFYTAVPLLTPHVYRQARLINTSEHILLPGAATMYLGTDFVGRMELPLVAIGESFVAGFGADPQLQVSRELLSRNRSVQGGNQVQEFEYRIRLSSFKDQPVQVQVLDRLPRAQAETVAVTLVETSPALSSDPAYLRHERPDNLLRWDVTLEPNANGEDALAIQYRFKLEYDRNLALGGLKVGE